MYLCPHPTVSAIITNENEEILLAKRAREPKKGQWDVVGGFVEVGESLEKALQREVKEELGVEVDILDFIGGFSHLKYRLGQIDYPILGLFYSARIKSGIPKAYDDISEFRFIKKDNITIADLAFDDVRQAMRIYLSKY